MVTGTLYYGIASGPDTFLSFHWLLCEVLDMPLCLSELCQLVHMGSQSCVFIRKCSILRNCWYTLVRFSFFLVSFEHFPYDLIQN